MEPITKGTVFKVHWKGHEECYRGREYKVVKLTRGCTCPNPNWFINGEKPIPRKPHLHIIANMVKCPFSISNSTNFMFGGYDEDLKNINDPDNDYLEIISQKGCQLSLF